MSRELICDYAADPHNIHVAIGIGVKAARGYPWLKEEAVSGALFGLVAAARTYRGEYDPKAFWGYARHRVRGEAIDAIKLALNFERQRGDASTADILWMADSGELPIGWEIESEEAVEKMTAGLPRGYRQRLRDHFLRADCADCDGLAQRHKISLRRAQALTCESKRFFTGKPMRSRNRGGQAA